MLAYHNKETKAESKLKAKNFLDSSTRLDTLKVHLSHKQHEPTLRKQRTHNQERNNPLAPTTFKRYDAIEWTKIRKNKSKNAQGNQT